MKRSKAYSIRLPLDVANVIESMVAPQRPAYKIVRDLVVSSVRSLDLQLSNDTIIILSMLVVATGYASGDALVKDLCLAFERYLAQARGKLKDEDAVNIDIVEMFSMITEIELITNEKEIRIRKHT